MINCARAYAWVSSTVCFFKLHLGWPMTFFGAFLWEGAAVRVSRHSSGRLETTALCPFDSLLWKEGVSGSWRTFHLAENNVSYCPQLSVTLSLPLKAVGDFFVIFLWEGHD